MRAAALDALRPTLACCLELLAPPTAAAPPSSSTVPPPLTSGLGTAAALAAAARGAVQEVLAAQGVIGPLRERWCEWLAWATSTLENAGIATN